MINNLFYIGIVLFLFLTNTTANSLNIKQVVTTSSILLLVLFFIKVHTIEKKVFINHFKYETKLIVISILIIIIQFLFGNDVLNLTLLPFVISPCIYILLFSQKYSLNSNFKYIIIIFFFVECGLAVYEKIYGMNVFPIVTKGGEEVFKDEAIWSFRSTALLGHPLNNALCVSTILAFILCSSFNKTFKYVCLSVGFISLLCFNARGAILIWILLGFVYLFSTTLSNSNNALQKVFFFLLALGILYGVNYLLVETYFGGRLVNQTKLYDGSAKSRIDVFSAFNFISSNELLIGDPNNYLKIMRKLGASGIENSFIVFIVQYGIVMAFLLIRFLYLVIKKNLIYYNNFEKIIVIVAFIGVGSTNNGLTDSKVWGIYFLCASVFFREKSLEYFNKRQI